MSHQPYFVKCLPPELWLFKKGRTKIQSFYYSQFCYYTCRILRDSSDQCEDISLDDGTNNFWSNPICIKSYFKTRCVTKTSNYCVVAELTVSVFMYHIQCSNECLKKEGTLMWQKHPVQDRKKCLSVCTRSWSCGFDKRRRFSWRSVGSCVAHSLAWSSFTCALAFLTK